MALQHLIEEFGRSTGMPGLQANAQDVVSLGVTGVGDLYIESVEEDAVVYLIRDLPYPTEGIYRAALKFCHPAERLPFPAHAGLRGENRLGFFIRLKPEDQTLPRLEQAIDQLRQLQDRLANVS